jgi:transposase
MRRFAGPLLEAAMRPVELRRLSREERDALERLAHSRTAPARAVERARIVWQAHTGAGSGEIAAARGVDPETVRRWLKRFNAEGLAGLEDRPRSGCPPTYSPEEVAEIIAAALTKPADLGLDFACWTLDRLVTYLAEVKRIAMKRTRLDEVLRAEGLRWRKHETWFGERVDPEFAGKRGSSSGSTPRRPSAASSSASTRWAPRAPRASPGRSSSERRSATAVRPSAPAKKSTTGVAAKATSSAPSGRRRARP